MLCEERKSRPAFQHESPIHFGGKVIHFAISCCTIISVFKMPYLRHVREMLLLAYDLRCIDEVEFAILYDLNKTKTPEIPYWQYEKFDLESMNDDECRTEFRFEKEHLYNLVDSLQLDEDQILYNRLKVDSIEAVCILLKRLSYPCRYSDMVPRFARPAAELSAIHNHMINRIYNQWGFLLRDFNREQLAPQNLQRYAHAIHAKGAPLTNCLGFLDGTVCPVSRPGHNQRVLYNGHKRVHAIKFQSVATPDGLVALLHGLFEGKRHDSGILRESGLLRDLEQHSVSPNGEIFCIYGDPAYPLRPQLQASFKGAVLTEDQSQWNRGMSSVRISVEWLFGDFINYFKFLDFKKNLKIQLSVVGKMYIVGVLLQNARNYLYGSSTSSYFELQPPTLQQYFTRL